MTTAAEAGLLHAPTLDGTSLADAAGGFSRMDVQNILHHSLTPSNVRPKLDAFWMGEKLPNLMDRFEWVLPYEIGTQDSVLNERLEDLRTEGTIHTFADWKKRKYTYTLGAGQQFLYLPRRDAYSLAYSGRTAAEWKAVVKHITAAGVSTTLTTSYAGTVDAATVVAAGAVTISDTTINHPTAGIPVAPFKVGATIATGDKVKVEFHALYRVVVVDVPTVPFETFQREDKVLYLAEVA